MSNITPTEEDPVAVKAKHKAPAFDLVNEIIRYENGETELDESLALFSHLIGTGQVWSLQGSYGRQASSLINAGLIDEAGTINWEVVDSLGDW